MVIRTDNLPWAFTQKLRQLLQDELLKAGLSEESGAVITFRDPDFSADTGGVHPVEIYITHEGELQYITDFAYYGRPPQCELVKEIDYDFANCIFQHFGVEYPIKHGHELFKIWESNFLEYHRIGAFSVTVEPVT